ncbi:hypothetical protein Tco_1524229 [Tanacetum coccineum]
MSPVDINLINSSAYEEGRTTIVGCENDTSIQKFNGLLTLEKEMETRVRMLIKKDKNEAKTDKAEHGNGKSTESKIRQSRAREWKEHRKLKQKAYPFSTDQPGPT